MDTEIIYWNLVLFAEFCHWDYFFHILENYVLNFTPNSSSDLLIVYFNQTHARSYTFLEAVSNLYRLPSWFIMDLIYDENAKVYSKTSLQSVVQHQFRVSVYDEADDEII
jgi:hypothetical protein